MLWRRLSRRAGTQQQRGRRDRRAAPQPADRRSHHQGRAAGAGVLGAGPERARHDAHAARHHRPAGGPRRAAQVRPLARRRLGAGAEEGPGRPVRRRPPVHAAAQDGGRRPCRGGRPRHRRAGHPAPARGGRAQARPRQDPGAAPPAGARYAGRAHAAQLAAAAGVVPPVGRPHRVGQRSLREGRRGARRQGGARAPDRAARDAPARGGAGGARPRARPIASACI